MSENELSSEIIKFKERHGIYNKKSAEKIHYMYMLKSIIDSPNNLDFFKKAVKLLKNEYIKKEDNIDDNTSNNEESFINKGENQIGDNFRTVNQLLDMSPIILKYSITSIKQINYVKFLLKQNEPKNNADIINLAA